MNDDKNRLIMAAKGLELRLKSLGKKEADKRFEASRELRRVQSMQQPKRLVTSSGAWDRLPKNRYVV